MKVTLTVCDVCNDKDAPTKGYEIRSGDRKAKADLCEAHGQPLEAYLQRTPAKPSAGRTASPRTRARVTTIEEIEAKKK